MQSAFIKQVHSRKNNFQVQHFLLHSVVDAADGAAYSPRRAFVSVFSFEKVSPEKPTYLIQFVPYKLYYQHNNLSKCVKGRG